MRLKSNFLETLLAQIKDKNMDNQVVLYRTNIAIGNLKSESKGSMNLKQFRYVLFELLSHKLQNIFFIWNQQIYMKLMIYKNWGWKAKPVWITAESWQLNPQYIMLYEGCDKKTKLNNSKVEITIRKERKKIFMH